MKSDRKRYVGNTEWRDAVSADVLGCLDELLGFLGCLDELRRFKYM